MHRRKIDKILRKLPEIKKFKKNSPVIRLQDTCNFAPYTSSSWSSLAGQPLQHVVVIQRRPEHLLCVQINVHERERERETDRQTETDGERERDTYIDTYPY